MRHIFLVHNILQTVQQGRFFFTFLFTFIIFSSSFFFSFSTGHTQIAGTDDIRFLNGWLGGQNHLKKSINWMTAPSWSFFTPSWVNTTCSTPLVISTVTRFGS